MRASKERVILERTFRASLDDVWELWTTKEGIESWWGPDGFRVEVLSLDLRPGGQLRYTMSAVRQQEIDFMKRAGMPISREHLLTFTEVSPPRRLVYDHAADFIPGVAPYDVEHVVELAPIGDGVRMVLSFEAMHDGQWTEMAKAGWESELGKLARVLEK